MALVSLVIFISISSGLLLISQQIMTQLSQQIEKNEQYLQRVLSFQNDCELILMTDKTQSPFLKAIQSLPNGQLLTLCLSFSECVDLYRPNRPEVSSDDLH